MFRSALVVILALLAFLLLGGVGYYYLEIYAPRQYAKTIIPIYEGLKSELTRGDPVREVKDKDYKSVLEILQKRKNSLLKTKERLVKVSAPPKYQQLHKDFTTAMDWLLLANEDAEKRAAFLAKLAEVKEVLEKEDVPQVDVKLVKVKDVQDYFRVRIGKIKAAAKQAFSQESPALNEKPTYSELKASWQKAEPSLDEIVKYLEGFDPNMSYEEFGKQASPEVGERSSRDLDSFKSLLGEAISRNPSGYIMAYTFYRNERGDINQLGPNLDRQMEELKKRYP